MFSTVLKDKTLIFVAIISCLCFLLKFDISALNMAKTDWVYKLSFDAGTEIISWNYYRATPWQFPIIGFLEGYDYPTLTGSGMTGIIAPIGLIFKALSAWMPDPVQYFGWWFLMCFVLQGYFSLKILRGVNDNYFKTQLTTLREILATSFFILSPPMLFRVGHMNLFGHFLILAALALYFSRMTSNKKAFYLILLNAFTAGTSQYTAVMVLGISFIALIEMWRRPEISFLKMGGYLAGILGAIFLTFYLFGDFVIPFGEVQVAGFGLYSANLNTFFNAQGYSAFLPDLPLSINYQYEGFAYFGLGLLIILTLLSFNFLIKIFKKTNKTTPDLPNDTTPVLLYPIIVLSVVYVVYALSCNIGFNDKVIFQWTYGGFWGKIFDSVRVSGRFIWIPFYLIMAFALVSFLTLHINPLLKTGILSACLIIQMIDIQKLIVGDKSIYAPCNESNCTHLKWKPIFREADRIVTLPLHQWNFKEYGDFLIWARAASEEKKAITTGHYGRRNMPLLKNYETEQHSLWANGDLGENKNAIFIGMKEKLWRLGLSVAKGDLVPFEYDGYAVLVPSSKSTTLQYMNNLAGCRPLPFESETIADLLAKNKDKTVIVSAKDEATFSLDDKTKEAFAKTGATGFSKLGFRGAYVGIIHKGQAMYEDVNNDVQVKKDFKKGETLKKDNITWVLKNDMQLASGGGLMGSLSEIKIDGKEYSLGKRGLNFVVLNDNFEVIDATYFDTYLETIHAIFK
jgi:hypothetical protein